MNTFLFKIDDFGSLSRGGPRMGFPEHAEAAQWVSRQAKKHANEARQKSILAAATARSSQSRMISKPFRSHLGGILLHRQSVLENCAKFDQQKNACPEFHFWWKLSTQMRPTMVCFGCSTARKRCPRGRWIGDLENKKSQMDLRTMRKLKNMSLSLQRYWKNEKCEFGFRWESLFFSILHEGKPNSFRFCNTSWTRMRFLGVCKRSLKWICCCNLAVPF